MNYDEAVTRVNASLDLAKALGFDVKYDRAIMGLQYTECRRCAAMVQLTSTQKHYDWCTRVGGAE